MYYQRISPLSYYTNESFTRSELFEELGRFASKCSTENCYAVSAFSYSVSDYTKWGNAIATISQKSYKDVFSSFYGKFLAGKCEYLNDAISKLNYSGAIFLPKVCCDEGQAYSEQNFQCSDNSGENGISPDYFQELGCPRQEVCGWTDELGSILG